MAITERDAGERLAAAPPAPATNPLQVARRRLASEHTLAALVLAAFAALFLAHAAPHLTARFGESHDGRNAGVWASASRSLIDDPARSRLGSHYWTGDSTTVYADHPPLIIWQTAAVNLVAGDSRLADRAPAWAGSIALIVLLHLLLLELGLRPLASAAGIVFGLGVPMFLVYGWMLDTPVTSLPFAVALLLLWTRGLERPQRPWLLGLVSAACVLAGWQSLLVAFAVAAVSLWRPASRPGGAVAARWLVGGTLAGLAALVAWLYAAFWSFSELAHQFLLRSGHGDPAFRFGVADWLSAQRNYDVVLIGRLVLLVGAAGLVGALIDRRTRFVAVVLELVVVGFSLGFRVGAIIHDYWNYWAIVAVAVGVAWLADRAMRLAPGRVAALGLGGLLVTGAGLHAVREARLVVPSQQYIEAGVPAGRAAASGHWPSTQRTAYFLGFGPPTSWISYESRRAAVPIDAAGAAAVAGREPDAMVLASGAALRTVCPQRPAGPSYELVPVAELARCATTAPPKG